MPPPSNLVYVVDGDASAYAAFAASLTRKGYNVVCFGDAAALLSVARTLIPACILLDASIAASSGLDVLAELNAPTYPAPILLVSSPGCAITAAVDAMKNGAYDFIEKPITGAELAQRIESARLRFACRNPAARGVAGSPHGGPGGEPTLLTAREQEVLSEWVAGATSKEIARTFRLSPRTIEIHRSRIMKKLNGKNSADVVKIALANSSTLGLRAVKND